MMLSIFRRFPSVIIVSALLLSTPTIASVVMLNTRVIYPEGTQAQTLQFTNSDKIPYVIQIWSDVNNPTSTPDTADAPFVSAPALFRIEPNTGQSVRLIFTGKALPNDRESLFYLNTVQIPPKNIMGADQNKMMVILRNRMKIFYRPKGLVDSPDKVSRLINFSLRNKGNQWVLTANNTSSYYASVVSASVAVGSSSVAFPVSMIAPKTSVDWTINKAVPSLAGANKVKFTLINDYGGQTVADAAITR